jgi:hypothetical protein
MNFRTTLLILVLLIIAAAAVVHLQQPTDAPPRPAPERAAGHGERVFLAHPDFTTAAVTHLTVAYPSGRSATAAIQGGDWWQTMPARFELMPSHVRGILEAAVNLRWVERFTPAPADAKHDPDHDDALPSLDRVALQPPRAVLSLYYTDAAAVPRRHTIHLGRAIGGRAYVRVDDDPLIYVVDADLVQRLLPEKLAAPLLSDWRIRTIDGPDPAAVRRVLLRNGRQITELRRVDGRWTFTAPHEDRVDAQAVSRMLGRLSAVHIQQFVADDPPEPAAFGLDEPAIELVIETTVADAPRWGPPAEPETDAEPNGPPDAVPDTPAEPDADLTIRQSTLRIGGPVDFDRSAFFATWQDHRHDGKGVFTLAAATAESLQLSTDDLRDPRLTPLAAADIAALRIQRPDAPDLVLQRDTEGWRLLDQPDATLSEQAVDQLLGAITRTRAVSYLAPDAPGPEPVAVVTLTAVGSLDADPTEQLRIHALADRRAPSAPSAPAADAPPPTGPRQLVVRQGDRLGRVVDAAALDPLFASADTLLAPPADAPAASSDDAAPDAPPTTHTTPATPPPDEPLPTK